MSSDGTTAPPSQPRRALRKPMRTLAEIVSDGSSASIGCTVLDMSGSGARLRVAGAVRKPFEPEFEIPETFRLLVPRDNISIDCRLAWREGDMVGVAFTSAFKPIKAAAARR